MRVSKIDIDALSRFGQPETRITMNQRQKKAIDYLKEQGRITNWEYVKLCGVGYRTAHRDLANLIKSGDIKIYKKGRSTYYTLIR